jgi:DNA-binding NarL/FixJ family response regulator
MLLKCEPEIVIVGESTDASSLLEKARQLEPDLVLLDWELPGSSITAVVEQISNTDAPFQIIVLSRRPEAREAALTVGAHAFVSKTDPGESILETVRDLLSRQRETSLR